MKRDLDLIRAILLACEEHERGRAPQHLEIEGYTAEQIGWHVHLAGQARLLKVADVSTNNTPSPMAIPICISWEGYEFLEASRDEGRWTQVKQVAKGAGAMSLDVLKAILVQSGVAAVKRHMGLP